MKPTQADERFEGFADSKLAFFHALSKNQNREWFQAHKSEYEVGWATPMAQMLTELRTRIDPYFPHIDLAEEPKIFRIYRDVRFGADKTPYKTHIGGMVMVRRTAKATEVPAAVYAQFGSEESFVGAGQYTMNPDQLSRFRAAILDDKRGKEIAVILEKLEQANYTIGSAETMKRVPKGIEPDHPRAELLERKGLYVGFPEVPKKLLVSRELIDWTAEHTRRVAAFVEWLTFATA